MSNFVGLTQANALGQGGDQQGQNAQSLQGKLNALIDVMSKDKDAIQGNGLVKFQLAKNELMQRFGELTKWVNQHGIKLSEAQGGVNQTDQQASDGISSAASGLSALAANPNR